MASLGFLTIALGLFASSTISAPSSEDQHTKRDLKMVHVVMRHSIRAPVTLYPTDPYNDHSFGPNGRGQITMSGIRRAFTMGDFLRTRYDAFLGDHYNASEFWAQSTGVPRAQATIMTVNAAIWRSIAKNQQFDEHFHWFPVPVYMQPLEDDMLLLVAKDCPQYNMERRRVEESQEIRQKLDKHHNMMQLIEEKSGQTMRTFDDVSDIYATLMAEKEFGLQLPNWAVEHWEQMEEAAAFSFVIKAYNDKLQRFKGGVLLKQLISDWEKKVGEGWSRKMTLYGGHDSTIANLLSALKVFRPQVPDYATSVLLDLSYDYELKQFGLEVFTKNYSSPIQQMQIPGCELFCPIKDVVRLTRNVIPSHWKAECATDDVNYTPLPFEGP